MQVGFATVGADVVVAGAVVGAAVVSNGGEEVELASEKTHPRAPDAIMWHVASAGATQF